MHLLTHEEGEMLLYDGAHHLPTLYTLIVSEIAVYN